MNSLYIFRGLPGAGKSTLIDSLNQNGAWPVFSVDSYFTDPATGAYEFHFDRNHLAYTQCQKNTREAMMKGIEKIFLDNTFTLEWEMEPYFKLAGEFGYRVFTCTVENRHHGRNRHGIAEEQIKKMSEKYKVVLW